MGEVNQHHYLRSFSTVDRMYGSADDPTPITPTGFGNLYRSSHAVNHPSRTRWNSFNRVGTAVSPFNRRNLFM